MIRSVVEQLPRDAELIVVDQSEPAVRDATAGFIASLRDPRVRHLRRDPPGLPAARNVGVAASRGAVVLFLDDDVVLHRGCLAAHLCRYRDPTVGGVVGRIVERRLRPNAWRTTNAIGRGGRIHTNLEGPDRVDVATLKGANMSLRRAALLEAGPFDEGFGGTALLEDADGSVRVRRCGWRLCYEPDAAVDHLHVASGGVRVGDALATERWRFHNTARFARRHPDVVSAPRMALVFGAIALRRAVVWGEPRAVPVLLRSLVDGWMR